MAKSRFRGSVNGMKRPLRRAVLGLMLGAAAAGGTLAVMASAATVEPQLPDLRSDPPDGQSPPEVYSNIPAGVGDWLIVRFDGYITNIGDGPLDIFGNPQVPGGVVQRARTGNDWTTVGNPLDVRYETADGHDHFHLKRAVEYALYSADADPAARAKVAPGSKVGFCLFDTEPVLADQDEEFYDFSVSHFCETGDPGATSLRMGVSRGWRDVYSRSLQFQYVNISNVPPGRYLLGATADPDNQIVETNEVNPTAFAEAPTTIPGVVAAPVQTPLDHDAQVPVRLAVTSVGTGAGIALRNRRFRVVQAPVHGHLDRLVGETFGVTTAGTATVRYTPDPGFRGTDAFKYVALSTFGSEALYPSSPPSAGALLVGSGAAVSISGAPARLTAGTSARLSAALVNVDPGVTWSVNGIPGGEAGIGTVTPEGVYVAPATPPPAPVTIRATSVADPAVYDEVTITVVPVPDPVPLPVAPAPSARTFSSNAALTTPTVGLRGARRRIVVVGVVAGRSGGIVITARDGKRSTRACRMRVSSGQSATCRLALRPGMRPAHTVVIALLRASDGKRVLKRARVPHAKAG
jgi:Lysyl oxidase